MSLAHYLKASVKHTKCGFVGHDVNRDDAKRLFSEGREKVYSECKRCHTPLRLVKGIGDTYIVHERYTLDE